MCQTLHDMKKVEAEMHRSVFACKRGDEMELLYTQLLLDVRRIMGRHHTACLECSKEAA